MEKTEDGLVKGVLSGDCIIISGKMKKNSEEAPEEKTLYLSLISAPRSGNSNNPDEEPLGWEARDFLRQQVLGKVIKYTNDYKINDRQYGQVFVDDKNINVELVSNGLAKVFTNKQNESQTKSDLFKKLQEVETQAKKSGINIWKTDPKFLESKKRKINQFNDSDNKSSDFLKANKGKELDAIVEYVVNCTIYSVYLKDAKAYIKVNLRFLAIPAAKDQILYKGGKAYAERQALHRDVKVVLYNLDESSTFNGDILVSEKGSLSLLILKSGYAKVFVNNSITYNAEELNAAKEAQTYAKNARLRIWKNEPDEEGKSTNKNLESNKGLKSEIIGTCIQVHSGDSISVKDSKTGNIERIFLSHLKAPSLAKIGTTEQDQPWAWQAREYLRKVLIGRNIKCEYDYSKTLQKDNKQMHFYTILRLDTGKDNKEIKETNINSNILEQGYASFATVRGEETPSKYVDKYIISEKQAKDSKVGLHSNKAPGNPNYSDLISANKTKKKEFISFLVNQKKLQCTVEYVFSGSKLKLRIEKNKCMVPFNLLGIKTFSKDKNNTEIYDKYFKLAADFTNETILQREGTCDIIQADRVGNYFGYLFINNVNFATTLLKEGLAVVNPYANTIYNNEFKTAEKEAENNKKGIWSVPNLANFLKEGENTNVSLPNKFEEKDQDIKFRITDYIDFNNFYIQITPNKSMEKIEKVLAEYDSKKLKGTPIEPPVKLHLLCAAKYSVDNKYYRARITHIYREDCYEVEFMDYGTIDKVYLSDLIKLDTSIATIEPQALLCELAYLRYSVNSMKKALDKFPDFSNTETILNGKLLYTYNTETRNKAGVIVYNKGGNIKNSMNADLLKLGYSKIDKKKGTPTVLNDLKEIEKKAESENVGLWASGEASDYDEEEEN
jgi:staphylococcal nuclease domain-containing protein 1